MTLLNDISRTVGEKVYKTRQGYLITLTKPVRQNPIIVPTKNAFEIRDKNLADLPIGFQITDNNGWLKQYWTLNGMLHSDTGPAQSCIFTRNEKPNIWLDWYWNDSPHRRGGPSRERLEKVSTAVVDDNTTEEHIERAVFVWYRNGVLWGKPEIAIANNLTRTRFAGEVVRIEAPLIEFKWKYHTMDFDTKKEYVLPERIVIEDFCETRGDNPSRTGRITQSSWLHHGGRKDVDGEETGFPQDFYLKEFNLWDWPFYKDSSIEYLMYEEFQKAPMANV